MVDRCRLMCFVSFLMSVGLMVAQTNGNSPKGITKAQLEQLLSEGTDSTRLAKDVAERGVGFELSAEDMVVLRQMGAETVLLKSLGEVAVRNRQKPFDRDLLRELAATGIDRELLARAVRDYGIDFDPTKYIASLQFVEGEEPLVGALREASPIPLSQDQILKLIMGGVSTARVAALVARRGIDVKPTELYLEALHNAGAGDELLQLLRKIEPQLGEIRVETVPGAEVYIDREFRGYTNSEGRLIVAGVGTGKHWVKICQAWKRDYTKQMIVLANQRTPVIVILEDGPSHAMAVKAVGITSLGFSSDGRYLMSGAHGPSVTKWDIETGTDLYTLAGFLDPAYSMAFSPDGRYFASGDYTPSVVLCDAATGRGLHIFRGQADPVFSVAFSPDNHFLASGSSDGTVTLWDRMTGQELHTLRGHTSTVHSVAFSPDGHYIASGSSDTTIKLWEIATGVELRTLKDPGNTVSFVVFSPDGRYLASGSGDTVKLWEMATGQQLWLLQGHHGLVSSAVFSPDGRYLASGSLDKTVKLWELATGKEVRTLRGHTDAVRVVAYSADGRYLASASSDDTVAVWRAK